MLFNVNHYVRLRLTDEGRRIHRANYDGLMSGMPSHVRDTIPYVPPETDAEGWSKFQMWDAMRIFGPWMAMTARNPFDLTIDIVEQR